MHPLCPSTIAMQSWNQKQLSMYLNCFLQILTFPMCVNIKKKLRSVSSTKIGPEESKSNEYPLQHFPTEEFNTTNL